MKGSRNDRVMVPDRLRRLVGILHGSVQGVEILGRQASQNYLSQGRMDRPLDLGPVSTHRRWREIHSVALFEPLVQQLTECESDPFGS
jgi:hypothetical protein